MAVARRGAGVREPERVQPNARRGGAAARAVLLGAICVLALALRLWGINFGLPYLYHPDEPAYVLQALAVARGIPDGLTFANPPLYKYGLLALYAVTFVIGRLTGLYASQQQFMDQFRADPSLLYLLARIASACFGALTVLATYALATLAKTQRAGFLAALFSALTFLLVRDSHFGVNDALVTLCVAAGLVCCLKVAHGGSQRDSILAGIALGLAFSAKYQGAILLLPIALAHRNRRHFVVALAAACVTTLLTFPSLVAEPVRVVQDIYIHLYVPAHTGYDGLDPGGAYSFYAKTLALGLGWPMLLLACAAIAVAVVRRDRAVLIVASVPLALFALLGTSDMYFARFILPALPPLVVLGALALDEGMARSGPFIGAALAVLVVLATLPDAIRFDALLTQTDTRTQAHDWIATNLPKGEKVAVDSGPLGPDLTHTGADVLVVNDFALYDHSVDDYRQNGTHYIVVSSFVSEIPVLDPARDARRRAFYASLQQSATRIVQFQPYANTPPPLSYDQIYGPFDSLSSFVRPGPTITIYELNR